MVFISFLSNETDAGDSEHRVNIRLLTHSCQAHAWYQSCYGISILCCLSGSASIGLNILHDGLKSNTHLQDPKSMLTAGKIGFVLFVCLIFKKKSINPKFLPAITFQCINIWRYSILLPYEDLYKAFKNFIDLNYTLGVFALRATNIEDQTIQKQH